MKIRIKGNTVRYRLSKTEVTALASEGLLEEETAFINATLKYAVQATDKAQLWADFYQQTITLYVPKAVLRHWAESEQIGIEAHMPLTDNASLHLLLEKDFKCMDADVKEDQSDNFENPHLSC